MKESFVITHVSRADLESLGYDASQISDALMERMASKMADDYCDQLFWTSLEIIADYLSIPKKKTKMYELTEKIANLKARILSFYEETKNVLKEIDILIENTQKTLEYEVQKEDE